MFSERLHKTLPWLVLLLIAVATFLTSFLAIYPDEVAYKIFLERYFINGGFKQSVTPFCTEGFLFKPSAILTPAAYFWSVLTWLGDGWPSYRALPYLCLAAIFAILIAHNRSWGNRSFWPLLLIVTLGPAYYGLVMLRPEIFILAVAVALFAIGRLILASSRTAPVYLGAFVMLALYSIIAYIHPKSLYVFALLAAVVVLAMLHLRGWAHRILFVVLSFGGALAITQAAIAQHYIQFLSCKSLPAVQESMVVQGVNLVDLFVNPAHFFETLKLAFSNKTLELTINRFSFKQQYQVNFLPMQEQLLSLNRYINWALRTVIGVATLYVLAKTIACFFLLKGSRERKQFILIFAFGVSLLTPFLLNITRHFYEISLFIGTLTVLCALLWPLPLDYRSRYKTLAQHAATCVLLLSALASSLMGYHVFTKPYRGGYEGSGHSYATQHEPMTREVTAALAKLGIPPAEPMIIEDLTYAAVKRHSIVLPITYLAIAQYAPERIKFFLDMWKARYGIVRCKHLKSLVNDMMEVETLATVRYTQQSPAPSPVDLCIFKVVR